MIQEPCGYCGNTVSFDYVCIDGIILHRYPCEILYKRDCQAERELAEKLSDEMFGDEAAWTNT